MKQYSFITPFYKKGEINLIHLSQINMDGKTLKPRVPSSAAVFYFDKNGKITSPTEYDHEVKEDTKTPRVCFGRSIQGCMNSVPYSKTRVIWYVHKPVNIDYKYLRASTTDEVPDRDTSNEMWYLKPVKIKCVGMIFVSKLFLSHVRTKNGMGVRHCEYQFIDNTGYEPPYSIYELLKYYGEEKTNKMLGPNWTDLKKSKNNTPGQRAHAWRVLTGLELVHPEPSLDEQTRVWKNWNKMLPEMKKMSDKKCIELYGCDNKTNFKQIMKEKWGECV